MTKMSHFANKFERKNLSTIYYQGRSCWIGREIGRILGYSVKGKRLVNKIMDEWSDEFINDVDFAIIEGEQLVEFKRLYKKLAGKDPYPGLSKINKKLLLLFEPGLHLCCLKTQKPIGKKLRRFLVDEVLPQLHRTGYYMPEKSQEDFFELENLSSDDLILKKKEIDFQDRQLKFEAIGKMLGHLKRKTEIPDEVFTSLSITAAEIVTGEDFSHLKMRTQYEDWLPPTEIASIFMTSTQKVGRIISELGLRDNFNGICKPIFRKTANRNRTVAGFLYSPYAIEKIRVRLLEYGWL